MLVTVKSIFQRIWRTDVERTLETTTEHKSIHRINKMEVRTHGYNFDF